MTKDQFLELFAIPRAEGKHFLSVDYVLELCEKGIAHCAQHDPRLADLASKIPPQLRSIAAINEEIRTYLKGRVDR